jgi:beta-lactamase class A
VLLGLTIATVASWLHVHHGARTDASPALLSARQKVQATGSSSQSILAGAPQSVPQAEVQRAARQILDEAGGTSAMVILQPGKPPIVALNPTQVMPSASLYKLGVMAATYQALDKGAVAAEQRVTITQDEVDFYGDAPATPAGTVLAVHEALEHMITVSDNSAAGALIDLVGADAVNAAFLANGMAQSHLGSGPDIEPRTIAETTATDQVAFYQRLLDGQVVSRAASEDMLALLKAQQENDRLPAELPAGTVVAHKTGELDGVRNDSGVIFTPNGPIICAVLISDQPEADLAVNAIADAGRVAYEAPANTRPAPP